MDMTDAMRPAWLARSARLVVYAILLFLSVSCSGNGASPAEAPVERAGGSPVSRQPEHEATTATVPEPRTHDEAAFLVYLEEQLNRSEFDALRSAMSEQFVIQIYPTGTYAEGIDDSILALHFRFIAESDSDIRVDEVVTPRFVPPSVDLSALFHGRQLITSVVTSSGWGLKGSGVALLYLTEEEDSLRWAGLVLAQGDESMPFAPLPEQQVARPPRGLIYTLGDEWRQARDQGQDRLLARHEGWLSVNPPGTLVVSAEIGAPEVLVFDFKRALTRTIGLEDTIMLDAMNTPWLDEYTVVIGVAEGLGSVTQATTGRLALLDVRSSAVTPLGPEISTYAHPTATGDALIVDSNDGIWLRQGEIARFLNLDGVQALNPRGNLFSPVLAPDLKRVAGVIGGDFGRQGHGYVVVDIETGTSNLVHTFLSTPTDARVFWGIRWNEDGNWLALEPPSWDPLEAGVWLVRPDGTDRRGLGPGTANAVWLHGERLAYTRVVDGASRVALLDLATGETARLDLPPGARPVAFVAQE